MMILSPHISGLFLARTLDGISVALGISTGTSLLMELISSEQDKNAANMLALSSTLGCGGAA